MNGIRRTFGPHNIRLSAPQGSAPLELQAQAQAAARLRDLDTHVATAAGTTRSIPQWDVRMPHGTRETRLPHITRRLRPAQNPAASSS